MNKRSRVCERSRAKQSKAEKSEQCGASQRGSSASEQANRLASGLVVTTEFLVVLDHSATWFSLDKSSLLSVLHGRKHDCRKMGGTIKQKGKMKMGGKRESKEKWRRKNKKKKTENNPRKTRGKRNTVCILTTIWSFTSLAHFVRLKISEKHGDLNILSTKHRSLCYTRSFQRTIFFVITNVLGDPKIRELRTNGGW